MFRNNVVAHNFFSKVEGSWIYHSFRILEELKCIMGKKQYINMNFSRTLYEIILHKKLIIGL